MRRLLIWLAVLAALLAGADFGFRLYSESVVGGELESALTLSERPSVSFGGWPFTTHVISGSFPSVSFAGSTFSSHGIELRQVNVTLDDVRFPRRRLVSGGGGVIRASAGHGTMVMTGADITAALRRIGAPFGVRVANGRASVTAHGITVGLDLKVANGAIVLTPSATTIGSASVRLPVFIRGMRYTALTLKDSEAVLTVTLRHPVFRIPG